MKKVNIDKQKLLGIVKLNRENHELIKHLVDRFLCWKLPKDFSPDCGISFDGRKDDEWNINKQWPVGTNLFTASQAKAMFEHLLSQDIGSDPTAYFYDELKEGGKYVSTLSTNKPNLLKVAEAYHDAKCAESEPIYSQLCGCGKPVRYSTHSGMACNKISRCSTREELESKVIELTLQVTKAETDSWINYCEADATYYYPEGWSEMIDNWISVDDNVPEFIDGKDYSKNVFALYKDYQGKLKFSVFKYVTVFDDNIYFFTWARISEAYSDLREADCEYDDNYEVTHWMSMPSTPPDMIGKK